MAIGNAVQQASMVHVYDKKRRQVCGIPIGGGARDGLTGYTSGTVNSRCDSMIYKHDAEEYQISATPAR